MEPALFDAHPSRLTPAGEFSPGVPVQLLDVPETIPQLGYGSHQFFRYYGKFPSVVGREIISRFAAPGKAVLDCYAGSGTTLVEAQIAGTTSFGLDINPLAVLACNVKTRYYDINALRNASSEILHLAKAPGTSSWRPSQATHSKLNKWFSIPAQEELGRLRTAIDNMNVGLEKEFMLTAFLGIVRRCSTAYDGEVRPHLNPSKTPRPPLTAFAGKIDDMISGLRELDTLRPTGVLARTELADNRQAAAYTIAEGHDVGLVVAHPPYLNSFNYLQVFSLEFFWAEGIEEVWRGASPPEVRAAEHKAWPATNDTIKEAYYNDFTIAMKAATSCVEAGGVLAVVIGDATIKGVLEPVHSILVERLTASGLEPIEVWYRTTHYGIGKYAYAHRADYHGAGEKKDAILFFRVPQV